MLVTGRRVKVNEDEGILRHAMQIQPIDLERERHERERKKESERDRDR